MWGKTLRGIVVGNLQPTGHTRLIRVIRWWDVRQFVSSNNPSHQRCSEVFQGFSNKTEERSALKSNGVTQRTGSGGEHNASLEDLFSRLKQSLCDPAEINSAGGSGCKLCPRDWLLHGDKCYWLSNEADSWSKSHDDCSRNRSQMLVIQDQEQMDSLQPVLPADHAVWIGLTFNSTQRKWTWLDGASFHGKLPLPESSQGEESNCGTLIKNKIDFDVCSSVLKWLCQKAAFQL
ncbi:killer cell lectin-like receptor subfamily F member 1 [Chrysemys picta bellii]|uniref:killer cell lectin-like receptor subfamily F member 1 n=1 Tax=Chrysemys picta bellii TaxID=8478 RepID=UPI0032B2CE73